MKLIELILIAIGLAMDAFAVSICKGLKMPRLSIKRALLIALMFGAFQAIMPLIGWFLGSRFEIYITRFDHWIAFGLLTFIGAKMAIESFKKEDEKDECADRFDIKELLILAVATSIDALAVGITFAFLKVKIVQSVALIGIITFALSIVGVAIGHRFGARFKNKAELAGGVILVLMGLKILFEHLGFLAF